LWDDSAWDTLARRFVRLAREQGALGDLPLALNVLACGQLLSGDLAAAESLVREARETAEAAGGGPTPYGELGLAALRGRPDPALALIESAGHDAVLRRAGLGVAAAKWAAAVLHNGPGQYELAMAAAEAAIGYAGPFVLGPWAAAELIEAAVRAGQPGRAAEAMRGLADAASPAGSDWALGVRARSLALLSDAESAEDLYQAALRHLGRSRDRVGLARAHLLYGEWLRREHRRIDAREQLGRAHRMLEAMGAAGFAERARRELVATGATARRRQADTERDLTPQELQIAVRARDGQTNTEIGAELFLSSRTVEWHLRKVFTKLGITSRRQLRHALPAVAATSCRLATSGRAIAGSARRTHGRRDRP
jgi:ATP/maltotriose-dependent transcriptional regulator MalT